MQGASTQQGTSHIDVGLLLMLSLSLMKFEENAHCGSFEVLVVT